MKPQKIWSDILTCGILMPLVWAAEPFDGIKNMDFTKPAFPIDLLDTAKQISVEKLCNEKNFEPVNLYYRQSMPPFNRQPKGTILLLHERRFSADTWAERIGKPGPSTMQILAAAGYRTVAVDLPGFGQKSTGPFHRSQPGFLYDIIKYLKLSPVIILTPTESGSFSLPLIAKERGALGEKVAGFVPIVACCPDVKENWHGIEVPTLVVQGDGFLRPFEEFTGMPNSNLYTIPKALRSPYFTHPALFHTALVNFLDYVYRERSKYLPTTPPPTIYLPNEGTLAFDETNALPTVVVPGAQARHTGDSADFSARCGVSFCNVICMILLNLVWNRLLSSG